jgi:hypothetical protein
LNLFGVDLAALIAPDEWIALTNGFQKRHLFAHTMGVVDQDYLTKTGDKQSIVGRKIAVSISEVRELARIIGELGPLLAQNL